MCWQDQKCSVAAFVEQCIPVLSEIHLQISCNCPWSCRVVPWDTEPSFRDRGGRWFGFTGWGKAGNRKPGVAPCGNPKCFQSLKLDSLVFNPVLVFERELTDKWFILVELSEYTYFKFVVWCSGILKLYAKGKETCLAMHYPRDTETAFWQAALPANTW